MENDFAIYIALMLENYERLWEKAKIAYKDNRDIIGEFAFSRVNKVIGKGEYR